MLSFFTSLPPPDFPLSGSGKKNSPMTSPKPPVFDHGGDEHQIHLLAGGDGGGHCRGRRSGRDGRSCCCGGGCARGRRGRRRRRRPRRLRRRGSWFRCCCLPRCCWRRRRGSRRRKRRRRRRWLGAPAFLPLRRRRRVRGNGHGLLAPHQVTRIACSVGDGGIVEGLHELALQLLALLDLEVVVVFGRKKGEKKISKKKESQSERRSEFFFFFVLRGQANSQSFRSQSANSISY